MMTEFLSDEIIIVYFRKISNIHWAGRDEQVFGRDRWETSVVCTGDRNHTAGYVVRARTTK